MKPLKFWSLLVCSFFFLNSVSGKSFVLSFNDTIPANALYQNSWGNKNTRLANIFTDKEYSITLNLPEENPFVFPCRTDAKICSDYGQRSGRMHTGTDIKLNHGDSIVAAWDGVVRIANEGYYGYGKLVVIRHNNGLETFYSHLSKLCVKHDQIVKAGDLIGLAGRTGRATTDHLHFETRFLYEHFNPHTIIDFENYCLKVTNLQVKNKKFTGYSQKDSILKVEQNVVNLEDLFEDNSTNADTTNSFVITEKTQNDDVASTNISQKEKNSTYHIIKKGDTLYSLSKKYGISIEKICQINNIQAESILSLGQKIKLK